MGLYGPSGVLPLHYTQDVIDEAKRDEPLRSAIFWISSTTAPFSMFFRAWEKYRLAIVFENLHRLQTGQTDWFTEAILASSDSAPPEHAAGWRSPTKRSCTSPALLARHSAQCLGAFPRFG